MDSTIQPQHREERYTAILAALVLLGMDAEVFYPGMADSPNPLWGFALLETEVEQWGGSAEVWEHLDSIATANGLESLQAELGGGPGWLRSQNTEYPQELFLFREL